MSFLEKKYNTEIKSDLIKSLKLNNPHIVPRIIKISLNMGLGQDGADKKLLSAAVNELTLIAGQKAVVSKAKKSIAGFKIREGQSVGAYVTLRRKNMFYFLERLIYIAMPRIKDFRGLKSSSFDENFNFSFGIKEHMVFPELSYDMIQKARGLNVIIHIEAKSKDDAIALLKAVRLPIINMAKNSLKQKNNNTLKLSIKFSEKREAMKSVLISNSSNFVDKIRAQKFLEQTRLAAKNRFRNRCKITGRSRAYRGKFGMCGFKLRELAGFGMIMGVVKVG